MRPSLLPPSHPTPLPCPRGLTQEVLVAVAGLILVGETRVEGRCGPSSLGGLLNTEHPLRPQLLRGEGPPWGPGDAPRSDQRQAADPYPETQPPDPTILFSPS